MSDIFKGLAGGWSFLVSWVFPSVIAWATFGVFDFPRLHFLPIFNEISTTSAVTQGLALLGVSFLTGLLLSGLSTILFRLLEGYYLIPESVAVRMRKRQRLRQDALRDRVQSLLDQREAALKQRGITGGEARQDALQTPAPTRTAKHRPLLRYRSANRISSRIGADLRIALIQERLQRYPPDERQFGPTQFANAMRALESYGWDRYRLDSQVLWSELMSVVPDSLRTEEEAARAPLNFSVSMTYLSGFVGIACLLTGLLTAGPVTPVVVGLTALVLVPAWNRLATVNTRYLKSVVQAIVNVGRVPLAEKMGLVIPVKLEEERDLWEQVRWFVTEKFDERYISDQDMYRRGPECGAGTSEPAS